MVGKCHWETILSQYLGFSPVSVIPLVLQVHFSTTGVLQSQKLSQPSNKTHFRVSVMR
jgi:hypothetical protein